jgi:hypothetical protein
MKINKLITYNRFTMPKLMDLKKMSLQLAKLRNILTLISSIKLVKRVFQLSSNSLSYILLKKLAYKVKNLVLTSK